MSKEKNMLDSMWVSEVNTNSLTLWYCKITEPTQSTIDRFSFHPHQIILYLQSHGVSSNL